MAPPTAEVRPRLHHCPAPLEAVRPPVGSLDNRPDLMVQRLFEQITGEADVLASSPEGGQKSIVNK